MTKQEFLDKFKQKHPDKFELFDFSNLPEKFSTKEKLSFVCKTHGKLTPTRVDSFLFDGKCKQCSRENYSNKGQRKISIEDFISKCQKIHVWKENEPRDIKKYPTGTAKYDYSITKEFRPINNHKFEFDYICPIHGKQIQRVDMHEFGAGCEKCGHNSSGLNQRISQEQFINYCKEYHPEYDYSQIVYDGHTNEKIIYPICPEHGSFPIIAHRLMMGTGQCPKCKISGVSKYEIELREYIESLYNGTIIVSNRQILNGKELDIYLPDLHIAFEFNGLLWHSEYNKPDKNYHRNKYNECLKQDIHLITIWEDDWTEKNKIIKSRIKQLLGCTERKIYARNCHIRQLTTQEERDFLIQNHLQEYVNSTVCYGLFLKSTNELVSLMSFGNSLYTDIKWELKRFCTKCNTTVIGAASKLFKQFINKFQPTKILSYADCDWSINSENTIYNKLGFEFIDYTPIDYSLLIGKTRSRRENFTKQKLIKKGCPENMSEHEYCLQQGWYRIYGTGNLKYIWHNH